MAENWRTDLKNGFLCFAGQVEQLAARLTDEWRSAKLKARQSPTDHGLGLVRG